MKEVVRLEGQNHKRNIITASFIDSYCRKQFKAIVLKIPGIYVLNLVKQKTCTSKNFMMIQGWQFFSVKRKIVNVLGFAGHMVSVTTFQIYSCMVKAVIDNIYMNECDCVTVKIYKNSGGLDLI